MKNVVALIVMWVVAINLVNADTLTLHDCQKMAEINYSFLKNQTLTQEITTIKVKQINDKWKPEILFNGQVLYQSDVLKLPISSPGFDIPQLPHERYQATLDLQQILYDGGLNRGQKQLEKIKGVHQIKEIETDILKLRLSVNEVYFSILLTQKSDRILSQTLNILEEKEKYLASALSGGIISDTELLKIQSEIIKVNQQILENNTNFDTSRKILEWLIGENIEGRVLSEPSSPHLKIPELNRPELASANARKEILQTQNNLISTQLRPKISLFASGGVGYPNPYNFYEIDISPFYVFGARVSWKFWDWKTSSKEKQVSKGQEHLLDNQIKNINNTIEIQLTKVRGEMEKYEQMIVQDREMVNISEKIRNLSSIRLNEGVVSSAEYLDDVNAEKMARLNLEVHKIQWIKAIINYYTEMGNINL